MRLCRIRTIGGRRYWVRTAALANHVLYPVLLPVCDRRGADTGLLLPRAVVAVIR